VPHARLSALLGGGTQTFAVLRGLDSLPRPRLDEENMPRSRSLLGGLVTTAAAGLTLAGCGAANSAGTVTVSGSATAAAASGTASSGSVAVSGAGSDAYFPAAVGETWVYQVQEGATKGTTTNKVTAVASVASGTQVTMVNTGDFTGASRTSTFEYVIHSDGSISVPVNLGTGDDTFKVTSGGVAWPSPAQLASGRPVNDTITMSGSAAGQTFSVTAHAVLKGEGTQSVTVPAGTYQATVIDDVETESVLGTPTTSEVKTWVVNGVGPVKEVMTDGADGSSAATFNEVLTSFTKG
jgi:hypothetical protein